MPTRRHRLPSGRLPAAVGRPQALHHASGRGESAHLRTPSPPRLRTHRRHARASPHPQSRERSQRDGSLGHRTRRAVEIRADRAGQAGPGTSTTPRYRAARPRRLRRALGTVRGVCGHSVHRLVSKAGCRERPNLSQDPWRGLRRRALGPASDASGRRADELHACGGLELAQQKRGSPNHGSTKRSSPCIGAKANSSVTEFCTAFLGDDARRCDRTRRRICGGCARRRVARLARVGRCCGLGLRTPPHDNPGPHRDRAACRSPDREVNATRRDHAFAASRTSPLRVRWALFLEPSVSGVHRWTVWR
jgi:hypothetical protein